MSTHHHPQKGKACKLLGCLSQHERGHSFKPSTQPADQKVHRCTECNKEYNNPDVLKQHIAKRHNLPQARHIPGNLHDHPNANDLNILSNNSNSNKPIKGFLAKYQVRKSQPPPLEPINNGRVVEIKQMNTGARLTREGKNAVKYQDPFEELYNICKSREAACDPNAEVKILTGKEGSVFTVLSNQHSPRSLNHFPNKAVMHTCHRDRESECNPTNCPTKIQSSHNYRNPESLKLLNTQSSPNPSTGKSPIKMEVKAEEEIYPREIRTPSNYKQSLPAENQHQFHHIKPSYAMQHKPTDRWTTEQEAPYWNRTPSNNQEDKGAAGHSESTCDTADTAINMGNLSNNNFRINRSIFVEKMHHQEAPITRPEITHIPTPVHANVSYPTFPQMQFWAATPSAANQRCALCPPGVPCVQVPPGVHCMQIPPGNMISSSATNYTCFCHECQAPTPEVIPQIPNPTSDINADRSDKQNNGDPRLYPQTFESPDSTWNNTHAPSDHTKDPNPCNFQNNAFYKDSPFELLRNDHRFREVPTLQPASSAHHPEHSASQKQFPYFRPCLSYCDFYNIPQHPLHHYYHQYSTGMHPTQPYHHIPFYHNIHSRQQRMEQHPFEVDGHPRDFSTPTFCPPEDNIIEPPQKYGTFTSDSNTPCYPSRNNE